MTELQLLRADHADAVLTFERVNRDFFSSTISDRGDEYFERFDERHRALLAEHEAGTGAFHVLLGEDGAVLGRFNLIFTGPATAELGYRVAEAVAGRGVATSGVGAICRLAASRYGVRILRAATSLANVASARVLVKNGFTLVGPADPAEIGGKQGSWYRRDLAASSGPRGSGAARSVGPAT